jgi:hypothetical protein
LPPWRYLSFSQAITTVGSPTAAAAPHAHVSEVLNAGRPWIMTDVLPEGNALIVG